MSNWRLLAFFIPLIGLVSCSAEHSKIVVAEYGDNKIYLDQFEKAYAQSAGSLEKAKKDSTKELDNFIDLYLNYKMKLRDAEVRGYQDDEDLQKEFNEYKKHIGSTLVLDHYVYDPNLHILYERRKWEYRVSHLFLRPDSARNDKQIQELGAEILERLKKGEDFGKLARQYSMETNTKNDGGDVYYLTAGMVNGKTIEDAIYSTEPGQFYPKMVKSPFGYHIFKVTERIPRRIALRIQHILIRYTDSTNVPDTARALRKIEGIEKEIKNGADFGKLAIKYSQDSKNALHNGDFGFVKRGAVARPIDELAFKMKVGEVSPIVKSKYGFHIFKVVDEKPYLSYDQDKEELKQIYERLGYPTDYENFIEKLKTEMNYVMDKPTYNKILAYADTTKLNNAYFTSNLHKQVGSDELIKINGRVYTADSLFSYEIRKGEYTGQKIDSNLLGDLVRKYTGELLVAEKAMVYDKENPEFAKLLEDYKNGMYLFKLLDEEVWNKVSVDSVKVQDYYEKNKDKFRLRDRVEFKEIFVPADSLIKKCVQALKSGTSFDSLYVKYNQRTGYENKYGYNGLVDTDFNELAKQANALNNSGDVSKPFKFENGWSIVKLIKRDPARFKTFAEAKTEAASELQELESKRLEEAYLNRLKNVYHPKINYEAVHSAFKQ
jgi:peptidyl-prolyl cis-trans isomerase SurA